VVAQYRPAADRSGASPYLLALVARAYEQLGRREEAARYLDRAQGVTQAAIAVLPAEETGVAGPGAAVQQVRALLAHGHNGQARAMAAALRDQFPDSIDVETLTGDVALLTGDPQQALALYGHVAEVRRDFTLVERMVAALQRLGRDDEATALLAGYLRQNPRSFEAAALLGRMTHSSALLAYADQLRGASGRSESVGAAETALARR
jgi:cellulose synthase operon protein C